MFLGGQYGPDAQVDTVGHPLIGAAVTGPDTHTYSLDSFGNLTIHGPATDALTYIITPVGGAPIYRTVRVDPLVSELTAQLAVLTAGPVLTDPDGGRWQVTVDTTGSLTATAL